jgi:uncharacterized membrane protein YkgB
MSLSPRNSVYNAGPQLLRDVWGLTAVAILVLILRIIAKLRIGKFGADDILMISALVSSSPFVYSIYQTDRKVNHSFQYYLGLTL